MNDPDPQPPLARTARQLRDLTANLTAGPCNCILRPCGVWDSVSEGDWPAHQMDCIATLRDPEVSEPTFEEYHPDGTRYDSIKAPIALAYFPANRCDVHRCRTCGQPWLRYTEYGGYYIDHRVRRLDPALIV